MGSFIRSLSVALVAAGLLAGTTSAQTNYRARTPHVVPRPAVPVNPIRAPAPAFSGSWISYHPLNPGVHTPFRPANEVLLRHGMWPSPHVIPSVPPWWWYVPPYVPPVPYQPYSSYGSYGGSYGSYSPYSYSPYSSNSPYSDESSYPPMPAHGSNGKAAYSPAYGGGYSAKPAEKKSSAALTAFNIPNADGEVRWPLAFRLMSPENRASLQSLEAQLEIVANQAASGKVNPRMLEEANQGVEKLQHWLRGQQANFAERTYRDAEQFLTGIEKSLKRIGGY